MPQDECSPHRVEERREAVGRCVALGCGLSILRDVNFRPWIALKFIIFLYLCGRFLPVGRFPPGKVECGDVCTGLKFVGKTITNRTE